MQHCALQEQDMGFGGVMKPPLQTPFPVQKATH